MVISHPDTGHEASKWSLSQRVATSRLSAGIQGRNSSWNSGEVPSQRRGLTPIPARRARQASRELACGRSPGTMNVEAPLLRRSRWKETGILILLKNIHFEISPYILLFAKNKGNVRPSEKTVETCRWLWRKEMGKTALKQKGNREKV